MSARPDARWLEQVRSLTSASEPEVRVGAATLLAPHDPEAARAVLDAALNDPNPAIRDMAGESIIETSTTDIRALRRFLRSPEALEQVQAAGQFCPSSDDARGVRAHVRGGRLASISLGFCTKSLVCPT